MMTWLWRGVAAAGVVVLAACTERSLVEVPPVVNVDAAAPGLVTCSVDVAARDVACSRPTLPPELAAALHLGGQGSYVMLQSTDVAFDSVLGDFTFNVTVQNLIPQPLGTTDGTTLHEDGVRVFFQNPPAGAGGVITVEDAGEDVFTAAGQKFYAYPQIIQQNETSAPVAWRFRLQPGVTAFTFGVYVSAEVPMPQGYVDLGWQAGRDTLAEGASGQLTAVVRSAVGNVVAGAAVEFSTSDSTVASVSESGLVTAVSAGTVTITAVSGSRQGTRTVSVCPVLDVGEARVFEGDAGGDFCLAGGAMGAEYVIVTSSLSSSSAPSLTLTSSGIVPVAGDPTPVLAGSRDGQVQATARLVEDGAFHRQLQEENREIVARMSRAGLRLDQAMLSSAITPGVPVVGALMDINMGTGCTISDVRTGRVVAVSNSLIILADTLNPGGGFTSGEYTALADQFDTLVEPTVTEMFTGAGLGGTAADIDGNGRAVAFYTRAVNELAPPMSSSFIGGYFTTRDLVPTASCPGSNAGEMFYMMVPDPTGAVNGNQRTKEFVQSVTTGTLAHEYQHLINASRRVYVNGALSLEVTWLNEGLSHMTEEALFLRVAGVSRGSNYDLNDAIANQEPFLLYSDQNFRRFRHFLSSPLLQSPIETDDDLGTRGAIWSFLSYLVDRGIASDLLPKLMNGMTGPGATPASGHANLDNALGRSALPLLGDWQAALYLDDSGLAPASEHQFTTWNFRSLYGGLDYTGDNVPDGYQLAVRDPSNGVADAFSLVIGGSAFSRVGVTGSAFAGFALREGGSLPSASVRATVIRRR